MADGDKPTIDTGKMDAAKKASDSLKDSIEKRARASKGSARAMEMDADATEDYGRRQKEATGAITDQVKALGEQAKGLIDVSRYTGEVTGAIGAYIGKLKEATSLTQH